MSIKNKRISWDEYFAEIAKTSSLRSTCPKQAVGAVIVKDNQIISTGYNGAPSNLSHCIDYGCHEDEDNHCIMSAHAELNAIIRASETKGTTLYCTHTPCLECCKAIINAGIKEVIYVDSYYDQRIEFLLYDSQTEFLNLAGIPVFKLSEIED